MANYSFGQIKKGEIPEAKVALSLGDEPGLVIRSILIKTNNYFSRSLAISSGKNLKINKAG